MDTNTATDTATETQQSESTATETPTQTSDSPSWMESLEKALDEGKITLKEGEDSSDKQDDSSNETPDKPDESSEKAPEKKEEADDDVPKSLSPKAADHFKAIKAAKAAAEARAAELEAKLKEVESAVKPDTQQAEALQEAIKEREAKIAEYEKELSVSRIEATPEYKEAVVKPLAAIMEVAEKIAAKYDVNPKRLMAILEEADADRQGELIEEVASSFKERDRVNLYNLADDFSAVLAERDAMREKAAEILATREKEAKAVEARKATESKANWEKTTKKVWEALKTKVPLPLQGDELAAVEKAIIEEVSSTDFSNLSDDLKAFAAFSGATIPHIVKQNKALEAKVSELETMLKKYRTQTPGSDAGDKPEKSELSGDVDFLSAIEKSFNRV